MFQLYWKRSLNFFWLPLRIIKCEAQSVYLFIKLFIKFILKSLVIFAMWLALSGAIYSRIALSFALNHILFLGQWEWDGKTKQPIRFQSFFKLTNHIAGKWKTKIPLFGKLAIKLSDFKRIIKIYGNRKFWSFGVSKLEFKIKHW